MTNNKSKITASFILLDANSKLLKNIEYKVTTVKNDKESHLVKGKTNSKGATYEFIKPIGTKLCLYIKIGSKDFKKVACLLLPSTSKSKLKIRARVSAVLISSKLNQNSDTAGDIKRKDYQVVKDDTLETIAKKYNTNVAQLKGLNPKIKNINRIYEGDWLKVPAQIGDVGKELEDKPSPSVSTKPTATKAKNNESTDSELTWYERAWDSVKDVTDKVDTVIDKTEEAIKQGQQKIINGTLDAKEHISEINGKLYDTVFGDDTKLSKNNDTSSLSKTESSDSKSKPDEPQLDIKKEVGNNQKGSPAEQITYDGNTTVYHIYYDGRIERANRQAVRYARFIYYDESGSKHDLGKSAYKSAQRWIRKNKEDGNKKIYLIDIRDFISYKKGNVQYKIHKNSEKNSRYYLTGVALAAYLGALCKLGHTDISFNGFSDINGGPGGSASHINGEVGDMRYLRKDFKALPVTVFDKTYSHERNVKLVETLYLFGFGRTKLNYTEKYSKSKLGLKDYTLPHCEHYRRGEVRHHHHLHLQGLKANIKDIDIIHPSRKILNSREQKVSTKELRVRAFMRMLRVGEGTVGEEGYARLFGGRSFITYYGKTYSDHPRIARPFGKKTSTAAGAYQVMGYTWDDDVMVAKRKQYGVTSFGKRDQDIFAVILLKYARRHAWPLLLEGKIREAMELDRKRGYAYEWASLPPGRYGQPNKTMAQALKLYDKYFEEENNGKTDLHIEYGFLKEIFNE
ncbi:LysM peptidoglycan-binding domain-containing protein [Psychrobacter alimentarius]|uniref:LysM peptidoglycan-binding domain-containing protein n=1 Tax=Psychrobacter alimentarius TaxID=261164 RepID=UPI001917CD30|nr:LysM peptidoglycan-binding domain-containing protein [Psychrobacter alimentarius]